tara:strand:- start:149 stop:481 length:333 start_codon:yes stop_codon:yes gene_type:complete
MSEQQYDADKLIFKAKGEWFSSLSGRLEEKMESDFQYLTNERGSLLSSYLIGVYFDEILHDFMKSEFEYPVGNYQEDEYSQEFYEKIGCDLRAVYESKLLAYLEEQQNDQ